ncbi:hypothetical protein EJ02DRAFT_183201 [Clathrospora elynae]|uniref:Uncharacterized protein n=1 Tax=Clathrospora elynae TaxID=706981 RepID=A0A6A5SQU5_9PLEO|nr:hypothetical protein EJ02DRAFT_183201 [Clathrospora elynae]
MLWLARGSIFSIVLGPTSFSGCFCSCLATSFATSYFVSSLATRSGYAWICFSICRSCYCSI